MKFYAKDVFSGSIPPIIWDSYGLGERGSGIFRYAQALLSALRPQGIHPVLVGPSSLTQVFQRVLPTPLETINSRPLRLAAKLGWVRSSLSALLKSPWGQGSQPLIFHGLSNFNGWPYLAQRPLKTSSGQPIATVVTLHDLIAFKSQRFLPSCLQAQLSLLLPSVLTHVDGVIVISERTRQEVLERWPWAAPKLHHIPHGFDQHPGLSGHGEIALGLGRDEAYKRWDFLLSVWRLLESSGQAIPLVLVTDARGHARLSQKGEDLIRRGLLTVHTNLSQMALEQLWEKTQVVVQPSRFEGFGFPVAEGYARGIPVVASEGFGVTERLSKIGCYEIPLNAGENQWTQAVIAACATPRRPCGSLRGWEQATKDLLKVYGKIVTLRQGT